MIELILAVKILTVSNSSIIKHCIGEAQGCINYQENTIYLNKTNRYMKDFVLYHEIGHLLFPTPPDSLYPENKTKYSFDFLEPRERIADDFAWYIYSQKHKKQKEFYKEVVNEENRNFIESNCKQDCVNTILNLKYK